MPTKSTPFSRTADDLELIASSLRAAEKHIIKFSMKWAPELHQEVADEPEPKPRRKRRKATKSQAKTPSANGGPPTSLSDAEVRFIRNNDDISARVLAEKYDVSQGTIGRVRNYEGAYA